MWWISLVGLVSSRIFCRPEASCAKVVSFVHFCFKVNFSNTRTDLYSDKFSVNFGSNYTINNYTDPMSKLFEIDYSDCDALLEYAAWCITTGGVIGVPTDTIYGLAAAAQDPKAVNQLYSIKGRDPKKPIAICVDDVDSIALWGDVKPLPFGLLESLLPGPVTVVLKRTLHLNPLLNPSASNVGIRIPNNPFMLNLCNNIGMPLALTSANLSNKPSSLTPEEFKDLWPLLSAVFHSGKLGDSLDCRVGSTIVDLSVAGKYQIIRTGSALAATQAVLEDYGLVQNVINTT